MDVLESLEPAPNNELMSDVPEPDNELASEVPINPADESMLLSML